MAFGALMTFLTLAVFAVSSTSRSTRVQPATSDNRRTSSNRYARQGNQLAAVVAREKYDPTEQVPGCDESPIEPRQAELAMLRCPADLGNKRELASARIDVAESLIGLWRDEAWYCRSEYDAAYDRVVYGARVMTPSAPAASFSAGRQITVEDELTVFQSILTNQNHQGVQSANSKRPLDLPQVSWTEYAVFMAGLCSPSTVSTGPSAVSDASGYVQSGDWLRHSAAATLTRVGQMLEAAAIVLKAAE